MRLHEDGDISSQQVKLFYAAVRGFYCTAASYALANLPLKDVVLQNSEFVNFGIRESATILMLHSLFQGIAIASMKNSKW